MARLDPNRMTPSERAVELPRAARVRRRAESGQRGKYERSGRAGGYFVLPFIVAFAALTVTPLGYAIYLSLYKSTIVGGTHFAGLVNYQQVVTDSKFWSGVTRIVIIGAIQIPITLGLGVVFACIFDAGVVRAGRWFRLIFFMPFAVPTVVSAITWSFLLEPQFGPFTHLANLLGFSHANLLSPNLIVPAIIVMIVWQSTSFDVIVIYTALRSLPHEVLEAAIVDGAGLLKVTAALKIPMIRGALVMLALLNGIAAIQLFVEPQILSSYTLSISYGFTPTIYIYNTATSALQYNIAAAAAVMLGGVVISISAIAATAARRNSRRRSVHVA